MNYQGYARWCGFKIQREGNVFFITLLSKQDVGTIKEIKIFYNGKPKVAVNPPWDGGITWKKANGKLLLLLPVKVGSKCMVAQ
jgi:hypothetical protein